MTDRLFGNPVRGRLAPYGGTYDASDEFVVTRPFGDESMPEYGDHDGLDIGNGKAGDPIVAMAAGRVYQAFFDSASGGAAIVRIDHGDGWTTGYAHMSRIDVYVGEDVAEGDQLGLLDTTGWATGAHLHMDTSYQNQRKDPWPLLRQNSESEMIIVGWQERIDNRKTKTNDAAKFRLSPDTSQPELAVLAEGASIIPIARCEGQKVGTAKDATVWYANVKSEGLPGDDAYLGYLHSSVLTRSKDGASVQLDPIEEAGDEAGASKSAADAVRDAGVSALNSKAKEFGA